MHFGIKVGLVKSKTRSKIPKASKAGGKRHKTKILIFALLTFVILFSGINWLVDPYDVYGSPRIDGFNAMKPALDEKFKKTDDLWVIKPDTLILGTSRIEVGIDPGDVEWPYPPAYNLGLPWTNIYETMRYFEYAQKIHPVKQVILCLDFFAFNKYVGGHPGQNGELIRLSKNKPIPVFQAETSILSPVTFRRSLTTISGQESRAAVKMKNGFDELAAGKESAGVAKIGGYRAVFLNTEGNYALTAYHPDGFNYVMDEPDNPYRVIVSECYRKGIDLRILISPEHVRHNEVISMVGQYSRYESWKAYLVKVNEEEAGNAGRKPFPLWDFSGYNDFTTENVPIAGDNQSEMQWYWDSSHYKKELGKIMLDRVFNRQPAETTSWNAFGELINSGNIENHIKRIQQDRLRYNETHREDIAEIDAHITQVFAEQEK